MNYRKSTPNERVWCTTQLAKLSFNHSIGCTHSWRFSTFFCINRHNVEQRCFSPWVILPCFTRLHLLLLIGAEAHRGFFRSYLLILIGASTRSSPELGRLACACVSSCVRVACCLLLFLPVSWSQNLGKLTKIPLRPLWYRRETIFL